jgi:hypothetical protein
MSVKISWVVLLFTELVFAIFLVGFFPIEWNPTIYSILYTLVFLTAVMNLDINRNRRIKIAIVLIAIHWLTRFFALEALRIASLSLNCVFFVYVISVLIDQLARARSITKSVILQAINGYLLLGMSFSLLFVIISIVDPQAFGYSAGGTMNAEDSLYFSFVTMATVGYGEILPLKPYSKSMTILTAVSGQLYLAIIVALLVSKFSAARSDYE